MKQEFKKNIIKGSITTSIGTISGMVFQFITIMILARFVPKSDFGLYVLVMVIVNMFSLLGGLGVQLTMVKFIASNNSEESQDVLLPVLTIRAFGSIFFSIIFIFTGRYLLHLFDDRIYQLGWYILIIFILASYRDLFYYLMQGLKQFRHYSIVNVASSVFRVLVVLVFILFNKLDIQNLLIIEILATLQPLIHQLFVIPFKKYLRVRPTWKTYKRVIKFSVPLYINNLVVFLNGRMNIFIIGIYLNPASIANFSIANKVPVALKKIFQSFIVVYFPNLATLFSSGDKKTAVKLIEKSLGIFSITISLLFILSFLFRNELTLLLFSSKYAEASLAFALLILNFFMRGLGDLMGYTCVPAGYPAIPTKVNALVSVISIGLSLLLVPIYGFMGAVYSLLMMNFVSINMFYFYLHKIGINFRIKSIARSAVLLLIAPVSLLFKGDFTLILNIVLFAICLILGWFLNNELKDGTKYVIKRLKNISLQKGSIL